MKLFILDKIVNLVDSKNTSLGFYQMLQKIPVENGKIFREDEIVC